MLTAFISGIIAALSEFLQQVFEFALMVIYFLGNQGNSRKI
jgi:hypothetical protein